MSSPEAVKAAKEIGTEVFDPLVDGETIGHLAAIIDKAMQPLRDEIKELRRNVSNIVVLADGQDEKKATDLLIKLTKINTSLTAENTDLKEYKINAGSAVIQSAAWMRNAKIQLKAADELAEAGKWALDALLGPKIPGTPGGHQIAIRDMRAALKKYKASKEKENEKPEASPERGSENKKD
jgi:hypothetical protein